VKVGDLISFKPKSFGDDDWSNPGIIIDSYISKGFERDEEIWIVWINGHKCLINERVDDVIIITGS
jgi:hypothetical protein|tara:strand:+ start:6787 stop:6984 length:198 start_codon:yes stop_codon:yes gene_type:complete